MKKYVFLLLGVFVSAALIAGCGQGAQQAEVISYEDTVSTERPSQPIQTAKTYTPTRTGVSKPNVSAQTTAWTDELLIADFNSGEKPNNVGGGFGAWDKDPSDFSQSCTEAFDSVNRQGTKGFGMKLDYDVDSSNPAYNGFWMFMQNVDATPYENIVFLAKGDSEEGYTTVFKIELKNADRQVGRYYATGITDEWQEIVIPLKDFKGLSDFSNLTEFVIVFEDRVASNKDGILYIDDIKLTK